MKAAESTQNNYEESTPPNEIMTANEVAIYLRVSRVTVWRWCKRGLIPAFQVGRSWRIRRNDLLRLSEGDKASET